MATVWMRSKLAKLKRDGAKSRATRPYDYTTKPRHTDTTSVEIKRIETGPYVAPEGKNHRRLDTRCYGGGGRVKAVAVYVSDGRLLRGGAVVTRQ
jgi:hypothetical protein